MRVSTDCSVAVVFVNHIAPFACAGFSLHLQREGMQGRVVRTGCGEAEDPEVRRPPFVVL